jgi:hypothetical protein
MPVSQDRAHLPEIRGHLYGEAHSQGPAERNATDGQQSARDGHNCPFGEPTREPYATLGALHDVGIALACPGPSLQEPTHGQAFFRHVLRQSSLLAPDQSCSTAPQPVEKLRVLAARESVARLERDLSANCGGLHQRVASAADRAIDTSPRGNAGRSKNHPGNPVWRARGQDSRYGPEYNVRSVALHRRQ